MMIKLKQLDVGPIIGHTTHNTVRLWGAIPPEIEQTIQSEDGKFDIGVVRLRKLPNGNYRQHKIRFNANFHFTGVIELNELEADSRYEYQVGYTSAESSEPISHESLFSWPNLASYYFKTAKLQPNQLHFVMGSCLYPHLLEFRSNNDGPLSKLDKRIDKVFTVLPELNENKTVDFMLLMGDQIYADPWNKLWKQGTSEEEFRHIYRTVFKQKNLRLALANVPTYMVMDDHEINDDFTNGIREYILKEPECLTQGINAFYAYQAIHGPLYNSVKKEGNVAYVKGQDEYELPMRHYYQLDKGVAGFFVTDTRLERTNNAIMSDEQLQALKDWLTESTHKVKFVVSSVTVIPDATPPMETTPDNWAHSFTQRKELLDYIVQNRIKNVIFLSGDVHTSFACQLIVNQQPYPVHQLVCSGLFWPHFIGFGMLRWKEKWVNFGKNIPDTEYTVSEPLADAGSKHSYFPGNGIASVQVENDTVIFSVINRRGLKETLRHTIELE